MCILDGDGKVVKQELVEGAWPAVLERLRAIDQPFSVCYEASCGYGHLYDSITPLPLASHVSVAHPGQLRLIFRRQAVVMTEADLRITSHGTSADDAE